MGNQKNIIQVESGKKNGSIIPSMTEKCIEKFFAVLENMPDMKRKNYVTNELKTLIKNALLSPQYLSGTPAEVLEYFYDLTKPGNSYTVIDGAQMLHNKKVSYSHEASVPFSYYVDRMRKNLLANPDIRQQLFDKDRLIDIKNGSTFGDSYELFQNIVCTKAIVDKHTNRLVDSIGGKKVISHHTPIILDSLTLLPYSVGEDVDDKRFLTTEGKTLCFNGGEVCYVGERTVLPSGIPVTQVGFIRLGKIEYLMSQITSEGFVEYTVQDQSIHKIIGKSIMLPHNTLAIKALKKATIDPKKYDSNRSFKYATKYSSETAEECYITESDTFYTIGESLITSIDKTYNLPNGTELIKVTVPDTEKRRYSLSTSDSLFVADGQREFYTINQDGKSGLLVSISEEIENKIFGIKTGGIYRNGVALIKVPQKLSSEVRNFFGMLSVSKRTNIRITNKGTTLLD